MLSTLLTAQRCQAIVISENGFLVLPSQYMTNLNDANWNQPNQQISTISIKYSSTCQCSLFSFYKFQILITHLQKTSFTLLTFLPVKNTILLKLLLMSYLPLHVQMTLWWLRTHFDLDCPWWPCQRTVEGTCPLVGSYPQLVAVYGLCPYWQSQQSVCKGEFNRFDTFEEQSHLTLVEVQFFVDLTFNFFFSFFFTLLCTITKCLCTDLLHFISLSYKL